MKVISLNIWAGLVGRKKLLAFFQAHQDVDIFCLQEVWSGPMTSIEERLSLRYDQIMVYGLQEISSVLKDHIAYMRPNLLTYGLLMLVRRERKVLEEGDVFVHKERGFIPEGDTALHARNLQFVTIETEKGNRTVVNFHGLWNGKGKTDSEERLQQSEKIKTFIKGIKNPYMLCGDFNLLPETQSMKRLEDCGLRNLVREYGITSTRTGLYTKPEKFADYVLASEGVEISDFKVLPDEVSDHSPLYLDFT